MNTAPDNDRPGEPDPAGEASATPAASPDEPFSGRSDQSPPVGDPFAPPPGAGLPPFGGFRPPPPPPGTGGYATRYGLVRPIGDRYIAGVCGAFARATNTDPVLWRVGLPVLTLLGGFGALVYVLGWLLIPAEGDSASPLEALAGRGWSSTPRPVAIVLTVIAAIAGVSALFGGGRTVALVVVLGGIAVLWASRAIAGPSSGPSAGHQPWSSPEPPQWPSATPWRSAGPPPWPTSGPAAPPAPGTGAAPSWSAGVPAVDDDTDADTLAGSGHSFPDTDLDDTAMPGYRPPFAPYGPYAGTGTPGPYAGTSAYPIDFPGLATGPQPSPVPPQPAINRRTPARRLTLSAALLVVGIIAILDAANVVSVPASAYFAAALATVGLGLFVGAFFGRARGPITLGVFLAFALLASSAIGSYRHQHGDGNILVRPASLAALQHSYSGSVGKLTIDLRDVDFRNADTTLDLHLNAGLIRVILPPKVDTTLVTKVDVGSIQLAHDQRGGINLGPVVFTDQGSDGPGGGDLHIDATVNVGKVEVTR